MNINEKLNQAFGFKVELASKKDHEINGQTVTRYSVKRPNGSKQYHAFGYENGQVRAV